MKNLLILLIALTRLLPHPANVTPIGGMSLVGGAKLGKFWRWMIPFTALVVSDIALGLFFKIRPFSFVTPFIYAAFAINIFFGKYIGSSYTRLIGFSAVGSLQFFILTNLGVWFEGILYPPTANGLFTCFAMALPFLKNTFIGDLAWSVGLFTLMQQATVWRLKKVQTA